MKLVKSYFLNKITITTIFLTFFSAFSFTFSPSGSRIENECRSTRIRIHCPEKCGILFSVFFHSESVKFI